jgi:hypothetical protein
MQVGAFRLLFYLGLAIVDYDCSHEVPCIWKLSTCAKIRFFVLDIIWQYRVKKTRPAVCNTCETTQKCIGGIDGPE